MALVPFRVKTSKNKLKKAMVKKTTKTSVKKSTAKSKKTKKTTKSSVKKSTTKAKSKKTAVKKSAPTLNLKPVAENKNKMIKILIALLIIGGIYLLKDVFVVATVNRKPIFRWSVIGQLEEQGGRQVLDSLVTEELVNQEIRKSGIKITQEEVDTSLEEIETRLASQGMDLEQALKEQGMTRDELIDDVILQKSVEKIVSDIIEISDEEVDAYIKANAEFFPAGSDSDEVKNDVREQLRTQALTAKIQAWVQDLQDNASVNYLREYKRQGL